MHEVTFQSLEIRLQQPYWLCHAGDCEHFFVIEHVRFVLRVLSEGSALSYCVLQGTSPNGPSAGQVPSHYPDHATSSGHL